MLTFQEVVSRSFTEKAGDNGIATTENGTGPFKLVQWRRGESLVLERAADYFGGAPGIPRAGDACIDRTIIKIIPENASRVAALLAGDVHIINELPPHDIRTVEANPNTKVMAVNGTRTFFVALNTTKKPFDDVRVRQAANHALNRQLIIDKLLSGRAAKLNGVMSPAAFGHNPNLPEYAFDPKRAKALLAEAGYPNGIDVTLDADGPQKETAEAIGALLTQAGIRTKVVVGEGSQVRARWAINGKKEGDMWISSWGNGSLDPTDIFEPTLQTGGRGNSAFYSNKQVDDLLVAGGRETDSAKRAALYQRAEAIIHDDAPWIFLWLPVSGAIDFAAQPPAITGLMVIDSILALRLDSLGNALAHLVLPAITLGLPMAAILMRVTRASMLDVLRQDYITFAEAKGLSRFRIIGLHALKNGLLPTVTVAAMETGSLLGGNMVVETVFGWPGLGRLVVESIFVRNYPLVQAAVLLYAVTYVVVNFVADLLYTVLNPRVRA